MKINVIFSEESLNSKVTFESSSGISPDEYHGTYEVTPDTSEQSLATKDKILRQDLTIHKIPYYAVDNPAGGTA